MNTLHGLRVVNTRSKEHAGELNHLLREAGAIPLPFPCTAIVPVEEIAAFDRILASQKFDWICLTSHDAAEMLATRAHAMGLDRARLTAPRYAVAGAATAAALKNLLDIDASFVTNAFDADSMARECPIQPRQRVLMPVSDIALAEPAELLTAAGAEVTRVVVYRTTVGDGGIDMGTLLKENMVGAITFTSPAAVSGFVTRLKKDGGNLDHTRQVPIACIGPLTRDRAISAGMLRAFSPESEHTLPGLLDALNQSVTSRHQGGRLWG